MSRNVPSPSRGLLILAVTAALAPLACAAPDQPPEPVEPRVESPGLGIALARLPAPFQVASSEGDRLVLEAPGEAAPGTLTLTSGPVETGAINLVEEVKARRALFEKMPEGTYLGNRELRAPIGTAFSARGTYRDEGGELVEETWIYAIHPDEYRLLTLTFRYPAADDSQVRVQQLMAVLGEVEGLGAPAQPDPGSPQPTASGESPEDG